MLATNLFQGDDPLDQQIRMGSNIFTIVGVLQSTGAGFNSMDNNILVPLSTLQGLVSNQVTTYRPAYSQFHNRTGRRSELRYRCGKSNYGFIGAAP